MKTARLVAWNGGAGDVSSSTEPTAGPDLSTFLSVVAELLRETTHRFEETVAQVLELVMTGRGLEEKNLVLTLQDFDLLQQEFTALSEVLARYATASLDRASRLGEEELVRVLDAIPIADLRERISLCLGFAPVERAATLQPDEEIF